MVKKKNFRNWAIDKFWSDRCAAHGAIMDALDGFGSVRHMTAEQRRDFEIINEKFWQNGGLDMAYQEYKERDEWERSHLGTALRIYSKIDLQCAFAYCEYNEPCRQVH